MPVDEKGFNAFMLALHEHGHTGRGIRKCLEAYEAAKHNGSASARDEEKPGASNARIAGENPATPAISLLDRPETVEAVARALTGYSDATKLENIPEGIVEWGTVKAQAAITAIKKVIY